jgi:hypothetical protein
MLWLVVYFVRPSPEPLLVAGLCACILALSFVWISRFQIILSDESICYRTLFGGTRSLGLSDIERADIEVGMDELTYRDQLFRLRPMVRLVIKPYPSSGKSPMDINLKIFSRRDIDRVLDFLGPKFHDPDLPSN